MARVRKGELPWTRIDDLHKEAFEMLLNKRSLKHPGEEGAWEFTHLWHKLQAVARLGRGHRHDEEEVRRGHAQQRQRGAPDQHGQEQRHPVGSLLLGRDLPPLQARPRILSRRGRQHVSQAAPGDAGRRPQRRPEGGAEVRLVDGLRPSRPRSTAPTRRPTSRPTATGTPSATRSSRWRRRSAASTSTSSDTVKYRSSSGPGTSAGPARTT